MTVLSLSVGSLRRWLAVVVCGSSAALALWLFLQHSEVLVPAAARDIEPISRIERDDVSWRRVARNSTLATTLSRSPVGSWSTRLLLKGEPFDQRAVTDRPPGRVFGGGSLDPAHVAMAVPLDAVNGLGGALHAGDEVMVLASDGIGGRAQLLVPRSLVLEVRSASPSGLGALESGVAILQLEPTQAVALAAALSLQGTVYLAVAGQQVGPLGQVNVQLFEGQEP